ncbi:hypothetical protein E4T56_gene20478 [Termitomyces sp. T112]|nr:hypothetical protein E4T56_gene20478 [Termitomyces sp. T112]
MAPLANFDASPTATDTYPGSPKPQEPPPLFLIFANHHQLDTLVPPTRSGVSQQPQGDPHSQMIPSMYQHGPILDCNQHLPTLSSSAKPCRHSQHTPKFSGSQHCSQPLLISHLIPLNPAHTFAPTLDNSNTSPANPNGNSNTLSIAINAPPETFPHHSWPCHMFLTPYPSLPNPSWGITMSLEWPAPPTDPIRIPPRPALGLYPTPIDSTQLHQLPLPYPPPSGVPSTPVPLESMDNYSPPTHHLPFKLLLLLGSKGICKAYLHPPHQPRLPQCLHNSRGNLPENTQGTLGIDNNLWNKLHALVEEIHTSPNPHPFEDPLDPAHSFHVQCKEPIGTQSKAPPSVPRQQEELNAASSILRNLNPTGGLFDQPAAHTLALSTQPQASSVPSTF